MSSPAQPSIRMFNPETDASLLNAVEQYQAKINTNANSSEDDNEDNVHNKNEQDYAPEHQANFKQENVAALAMQASFFDSSNKLEGKFRNLFRNATTNTEYNIGIGPVTEINGKIYDSSGNRIDDEDDNDETFDHSIDQIKKLYDRQREEMQINVGGIEMSAGEWDNTYNALSAPRTRAFIEQMLMQKHGWSKDRAQKATDDALQLAIIAKKIEDGTATQADKDRATEIRRNNPDAEDAAKVASNAQIGLAKNSKSDNEIKSELTTDSYARQSIKEEIASSYDTGRLFTSEIIPEQRMSNIQLTQNFNNTSTLNSELQNSTNIAEKPAINNQNYDMSLGLG